VIRIVCEGVEHRFKSLPITIGRDEDNDLPVDDVKLSRHHCRICRSPEGFVVEDLDSSNGTYVNGAPTQRHVLGAGDTILIGVTSLNVEWDPEAAPPRRPRRLSTEQVEELQVDNRRMRRLLALTKTLAIEQSEEQLLRRILDNAIELTGAAKGFLFLVTLHGLDFRAARAEGGRNLSKPEDKISHSIAREAIESGRAVLTEDAGDDARFAGGRSVALLHLRSVLCVPLKVPDGPIGALYLEQGDVTGQFHPSDIPLVTAFTDFAALALATARNVAELDKRAEQLRQARDRIGRLNHRLKALAQDRSRELGGHGEEPGSGTVKHDYHAIVGRSPAMRRVFALLDRVIESDLPLLVVGESGTGKELVARTVHFNGARKNARFVTLHCAAIPGDLVETELFGREAGAYTGADTAAPGLFELADGGTLFLDEAGDMSAEVQAKLLRVLENGEVRRVGGTEVRKVSVRTITACSRDLKELVAAGTFREDLYFRLAGVTCVLPPLRERSEDVPQLFEHFLDLLCAERGVEPPAVDPEVVDRLLAYPWPGNVRELRNEVQRLVALSSARITPDRLSLPVFSGDPEAAPPAALPPGGLKELVENLERRVLLDTMRRTEGNKTRAASLLGLSRLGLRKKLDRYGLKDKV